MVTEILWDGQTDGRTDRHQATLYYRWRYGLPRNNYRVATFPKSYQHVIGIVMQSLKLIGQFQHVKILERAKCYRRTDGPTQIIKKTLLFIIV